MPIPPIPRLTRARFDAYTPIGSAPRAPRLGPSAPCQTPARPTHDQSGDANAMVLEATPDHSAAPATLTTPMPRRARPLRTFRGGSKTAR